MTQSHRQRVSVHSAGGHSLCPSVWSLGKAPSTHLVSVAPQPWPTPRFEGVLLPTEDMPGLLRDHHPTSLTGTSGILEEPGRLQAKYVQLCGSIQKVMQALYAQWDCG